MNSTTNWQYVAGDVEPGFYELVITAVEDVPDKQYLRIVYDIASGKNAGAYANSDPKYHSFVRSYKPSAERMFSKFLRAVEESNPGRFSVAEFGNDERRLVGMHVGAEVNKRLYTKNDGSDGDVLEVADTMSVAAALGGTRKLHEPRDDRQRPISAPVAAPTAAPVAQAAQPWPQVQYGAAYGVPQAQYGAPNAVPNAAQIAAIAAAAVGVDAPF